PPHLYRCIPGPRFFSRFTTNEPGNLAYKTVLEYHHPGGDCMWKEFKEFAVRGNVLDLAVGIVIGAGFGKIVNSMVNDVLMPPVGLLVKHVDFKDLFVNLSPTLYPSIAAAK